MSSSSPSTSVTVSLPSVMSTTAASTTITTMKKTDLDMLPMKTASPTNVQNSFNFTTNNNTADNKIQSPTKATIDSIKYDAMQSSDNNLYGMGITDDDKNQNDRLASATNRSATIQTRSLFDIDNASSLSLADKLRNEANKYSDDNAGRDHFGTDKELTNRMDADKKCTTTPKSSSVTSHDQVRSDTRFDEKRMQTGISINQQTYANYNFKQNSSGARSSSPTSPTSYPFSGIASSTSAPVTMNSHSYERRPSWRLKLDAGCKVCKHTNTHKTHTFKYVIPKSNVKCNDSIQSTLLNKSSDSAVLVPRDRLPFYHHVNGCNMYFIKQFEQHLTARNI